MRIAFDMLADIIDKTMPGNEILYIAESDKCIVGNPAKADRLIKTNGENKNSTNNPNYFSFFGMRSCHISDYTVTHASLNTTCRVSGSSYPKNLSPID